MKFRKQRAPLSLIFTGSMIGALLLVLVSMTVLYSQFKSSMLISLSKQNNEFAAQVSATSKFADEILINTANQVFYDASVTKLREGRNLTNAEFIEGVRQINAITASTTIVDSIYIYNGKQDYVYSTAQYGAVNDKASRFADQEALNILKSRKESDRLVLIPRRAYSPSGYTDSSIYSFMLFDVNEADNAIMLNLRASAFTRLYFGSDKDRQCFIINNSGVLIASQASETLLEKSLIETILREPDQSYYIYKDQANVKRICFVSSIDEHQWLYVKIVSYQEAFNALIITRNRTVIFLSLIIIILIVVAVIISKRIYLPLKTITEKIPGSTEQVIETIDKMMDQRESMEQFDPMIRSAFLKDILFAKIKVSDISSGLEAYHLRIALDFPVYLFLLDTNEPSGLMEKLQECIPYCEVSVVENANSILFLQPTLDSQLETARTIIHDLYPRTLIVTSSQINNWDSIPNVYLRLKEAWQLSFLHPEENNISLKAELGHGIAPLSEKSAAILGYLKKGYLSKAEETLSILIGELDGKRYSTVRTTILNLGSASLKLGLDRGVLKINYEQALTTLVSMIDNLKDIKEFDAWIKNLFSLIANSVQEAQQNNKTNLIEDIDSYLLENYTDISLSTKSVADHFGMSTAYLSRIYRQNKLNSLMSTVNSIRIEKAKMALENPKTLIKGVAQSVGIDNSQYFFSLFKKLVGRTPREYQLDMLALKREQERKSSKAKRV